METHELARAVTEVTLEGFNCIFWEPWESEFRHEEFLMFKNQVFYAMACFVWNIYDKEDFENIAFTKEIFKECENLWQSDSFKHGDIPRAMLSSVPLSVPKKLEKIREQDICNILKWSHEEKELKENEQKMETHELARAVTEVISEGFNCIFREPWESDFRHEQFLIFKNQVFYAMACFVWNIYDEEDFENIAFTKEIFKECENLWQSDSFRHGDLPQAMLSSVPLSVQKKLEKIREQDICNILKNFADFESCVRLHPHSSLYQKRDLEDYVGKAMEIMDMPCILAPEIKHHLRMELSKDKSPRCIVDALYMELWKHMKIMELIEFGSDKWMVDDLATVFNHQPSTYKWLLYDLATLINQVFCGLVRARLEQFRKCKSLVTYSLSSRMFGLWDNDALQVVERADLIRRSEGRRFISVDNLLLGMSNAEVTNQHVSHL